jgi:hypothetical protein
MHELGHDLGLGHGGNGPVNCKPNYRSVMNYTRSFRDTDPFQPLDYSRENLASLNEAALSEPAGLGSGVGGNVIFISHSYLKPYLIGGTDWNYNGSIDPDEVNGIDWNSDFRITPAPGKAARDINYINIFHYSRLRHTESRSDPRRVRRLATPSVLVPGTYGCCRRIPGNRRLGTTAAT